MKTVNVFLSLYAHAARGGRFAWLLVPLLTLNAFGTVREASAKDVQFITLAPGHFHAALVQKQMLPNVNSVVHVYAPLGFDLTQHLNRVIGFNTREDGPTQWQLEVHATPGYLERLRKEKPGNVVVISGRNAGKIELIAAAVDAGLNVLVDKPWIVESEDFPKLSRVLKKAQNSGLVAYDIMTERFEATNALQRALVNAPEVFGDLEPGTAESPGVYIENVHHFMKTVAGRPNIRPAWFFDSRQQGEGMADTGTHLVDLVQWTLNPNQTLDPQKDVSVVAARRWPTSISLRQFQTVTGTSGGFPDFLQQDVDKGALKVFANTQVTYKLRDTFVQMASMWSWQAKPGAGDWHYAVYRGSRAQVEVRQGAKQKHVPELYVVPRQPKDRAALGEALNTRIQALTATFPGISVKRAGSAFRIDIPAALRTGHEAHFSEVTRNFLAYLANRNSLPSWESANMLSKYWVTTKATDMSRQSPPLAAFRQRAPR